MKNLTLFLVWSLTLALFLTACNKEDVNDPTNTTPNIIVNPPVDMITASVFGQVTDEDGAALSGVTLTINNITYTTDSKGLYSANDIQINSYGNLVTFSKTGYFAGAKLIQTEEGRKANLNVTLLTKAMKGSVMSTEGGSVSIDGNSSVTLEAKGIKDSNGNIYDGVVNVYAKWLDPSKLSTLQSMPGDLRAVDSESEIMQLATYGMLAVELESPEGQALNIAEGNTAELTFDLPTSMVDDAPATIPLWYFDEATGYWIEEGEATLINGVYVGEVTHFSFWNCDAPFPVINASGTIVNAEGDGIGNVRVEISFPNDISSGYANTDNRGYYSGKIPKDETLIINVYNQCSQLVYTNTIGPFSGDVVIQPITINIAENLVTFSGTLLDCDGNAIPDGYVSIEFDGVHQYLSTTSDGTFESSVDICNDASLITAVGYNFADFQQSVPIQISIVGETSIDLGLINTCDDLESYFYYEVDGILTSVEEVYAQNSYDHETGIGLSGSSSTMQSYPTIIIPVTDGPGTYELEYLLLFTDDDDVIATCGEEECNSITFTFEELGYELGDAVKATFSGTILIGPWNDQEEVPISGAFKGEINL